MQDKITASLQSELTQLAARIAKVNGYTHDQHSELLSHLEDKAMDYITRETPMQEEDILILVREHFGKEKILHDLMGPQSQPGKASLAEDMKHFNWGGPGKDDFWGVFAFPWKQENRLRYALMVMILWDILVNGVLLFFYFKNLSSGWLLGGLQFIPILIATVFYFMYLKIGSKLDNKRKELKKSTELESEVIMVRGMIQLPGILQYDLGKLKFTPLTGAPFEYSLQSLQKVVETRNCNGKLLLGNNIYFKIHLKEKNERLGFAVSQPAPWRKLFKTKS